MFQHVRQHMPVRGCGRASAATARKLIATSQKPLKSVIKATIECNDYDDSVSVVHCKSTKLQVKCGVLLQPGQQYYMVRGTRMRNLWFLITKHESGVVQCSLRDVEQMCRKRVAQFVASKKQEILQSMVA